MFVVCIFRSLFDTTQLCFVTIPMRTILVAILLFSIVSSRVPKEERTFVSHAVDDFIDNVKKEFLDPDLATLFESCYPNTLDTTVYSFTENPEGDEDTFLITGDITAMWLRDSTNQVFGLEGDSKVDHPVSAFCLARASSDGPDPWCFEPTGEIGAHRSLRECVQF